MSHPRIFNFLQKIEVQSKGIEEEQDLVNNSKVLIFKNQEFNKGNQKLLGLDSKHSWPINSLAYINNKESHENSKRDSHQLHKILKKISKLCNFHFHISTQYQYKISFPIIF